MIAYINEVATHELSKENTANLNQQIEKYGNDKIKEIANNVGILSDTNYKIFLSDLKK